MKSNRDERRTEGSIIVAMVCLYSTVTALSEPPGMKQLLRVLRNHKFTFSLNSIHAIIMSLDMEEMILARLLKAGC